MIQCIRSEVLSQFKGLQLKKMTDSIRGSLVVQGYEPRDHFDVARFIWETLRLRGRQRLQELLGNTPEG